MDGEEYIVVDGSITSGVSILYLPMNPTEYIADQRLRRYYAKLRRLHENQDWNAIDSEPIPSFIVPRKKEKWSIQSILP